MAHELDDISRLLGNIESNLNTLGRRFDHMERRMDHRDGVLDEIQAAAAVVAEDVRYMKDTIADDIRPVTDDVKRWRQMGLGALGVIGVGGAAFASAVLWLLSQMNVIKMP